MSGCSCTFDGFLFGVIPFGFNPSSGGHDEAGFKNALFGKSRLSGEIPPELGGLANLSLLGLGQNQLSGEIPPELGDLASLRELYLEENQLTGCVPISLWGQSRNLQLGDLQFCQ